MRFSSELLLPRIKRRGDKKLENFIVRNINNELKNDVGCDLIQMQYFLESVFDDRGGRQELLKKLELVK
jgi:hypothetical protein